MRFRAFIFHLGSRPLRAARFAALLAGLWSFVTVLPVANATPVIYQFTAGTYTVWLVFDPATAIPDPNYATSQSAVYRGMIETMYEPCRTARFTTRSKWRL